MAPSNNLPIPQPSSSSSSSLPGSNSRPSSPSNFAAAHQFGSPSNSGVPSIPQIPLPPSHSPTPQYGSPARSATPTGFLSASRPALANRPSFEDVPTPASIDDLSDAQKADIVRKHLLSAEERSAAHGGSSSASQFALDLGGSGASPRNASHWANPSALSNALQATANQSSASSIQLGDEEYPTPYDMPGGDIVAPIYKWAAQQGTSSASHGGTPSLRRSKSLASVKDASSRRVSHGANTGDSRPAGLSFTTPGSDVDDEEGMSAREILEPGGFRRDFVIRQMAQRGEGPSEGRFTRSFVDFLSLYGHFGGEDLEEIEEEEEDEEDDLDYDESTIRGYDGTTPKASNTRENLLQSSTETSPLLKKANLRASRIGAGTEGGSRLSRGASRKRAGSVGQHGDATVFQATLMLLKGFVGTGILFLGKAFFNGGLLFSTFVLCFIAMISLYSFLLLVKTRLVVPGSFGDIGGELYGKHMRSMILFSIVISQIGFVAAYTIFVAQNLQAFVMAVTNCRTFIATPLLMLMQLLIFLPLAMIRNIQKLSGTALIADAFILFGLVYIFSNEIKVLASQGLADVAWFNPRDFPLLIGTAVFSFEGIGLIIPITESMKEPHRFPGVLTGVMVGAMILFAGGGALAYAAYGSAIQTVVFVNLPQEDRFVNAAQFLYSIAILLSTPLQLFPAVRIMENGIFSRSGKHSTKVKWEKNIFRMAVVVACTLLAWLGAADLDKFVSLVGSVACVPLCFCYPAMLHYKACATTKKQKVADVALFIFGLGATIYTTSQTVILITSGEPSAPPVFGQCPPRV